MKRDMCKSDSSFPYLQSSALFKRFIEMKNKLIY